MGSAKEGVASRKAVSASGVVYGVLGLAVLGVPLCSVVKARDLFELTVTQDQTGERNSDGFSEIEKFVRQLGNSGLNDLLPDTYVDDVSPATARLDVRGLPAIAFYEANSATLRFQVPSLGIDIPFEGANRDESEDLFLDFLEGEGGDILRRLLQGLVAQTPTDPVAGNPNSLMSRMAVADFAIGAEAVSEAAPDAEGEPEPPNLIGIGVRYDFATSNDFDTNVVTLPINYILQIPDYPRWAVIFDAPLTYMNVEGGEAYYGSFGLGVGVPLLNPREDSPLGEDIPLGWRVTPMGRVGIVGSQDIGAVSAIYSGSLTSSISYYYDDLIFTLNNMGGYYKTDSVKIGDFDLDYDLENGIFRNGLSVEGSLGFHLPFIPDDPTSWEIAYVNTQFVGDNMFIENYNEIVASFGTLRNAGRMTWQTLRLDVGYTFADDYDAFRFGINYRF